MNKFITTEHINEVQAAMNDLSAGKRKIKMQQYKFREPSEAIRIGEVTVIVYDVNSVYLRLSEAASSMYISKWHNDVGGVLVKAVKRNIKNVYELVTPTFKALIVKILEEELDDITTKNLDHVKMGDYTYTIIRVVDKDDTYSSQDRTLPKEEYVREDTEDDDYEYVEEPEDDSFTSMELF